MHRSAIRRGTRGLCTLLAALTLSLAPQLSSAATYTAADAAQFTSLLNSTVLGDTIVLKAGTTYTGSFTLPNKTTGTGYLTIQSSSLASLPVGRRVFPANAPSMPRIQSPGSNQRAIKTAVSAHHYKLIGLEIVAPADNTNLTAVVDLGILGPAQDTLAKVPHNLVIDRCIIRANSSTQTVRRGIALNSASTDITNCYIYDFKDATTDAQAICGANGPGPYNIVNNYLEAAAEGVMFGASRPDVPNVVPSDILISRNHFHKNPAWNGSAWLIKNHFELKAGQRVTIDGNVFQRSWNGAGGQSGKALTFKMVQDPSGGAPWSVTQDVTITNNRVFDCGIGVAFGGNVGPDGAVFTGWPRNFTIRNNLFYNVSNTFGQGFFIQIIHGPQNITFDHNTAFVTNSVCSVDGPAISGFTYTNNVNNNGIYGWKGNATGTGKATFAKWFPAMTWAKNVTQGANTSFYLPEYAGGWELAPFNNAGLGYPSTWSSVLQNQASPGTDFSGYKVLGWNQATNTSTYPYNNTGTDGKDIGCDIDALNAATAGCITGVWGSTPPVGTEVILDNTAATLVGAWTPSTSSTGFYGSNYVHDGNTGKGTKTATFTPNLVAGAYNVYARWTAYSNRASNVPFDITHAGGTSTSIQNQQANNNTWVLLGTYTFNAGTGGKVTIRTTGTNGHVIADAVKFTPAGSEIVIDNTSATLTGQWFSSVNSPGYFGSDYLVDGTTGKGAKTVRFTPNIAAAGTYQVYARWTAYANRASNTPFDITHAGGTATAIKDQRQNNNVWVLLGTYTFNAGTGGYVTIRTDATNGQVIADAVRFVKQ